MESGADYADSPRTRRSAWRALPLVALAACGEASTPTPGVDAGVPDPDPVGPGLSVLSEVALSSPAEVAAPLPGGRAVLQAQGDLHLTRTGTTSALAGAVGVLAGAAEWAGTTVVAGRDGVAVLEAGALLPSPLGDALPGFSTRQLLLARPGGRAGLWFAGADGLAVWADGALRHVDPDPLSAAGCVMTSGAPVAGVEALWLACQGSVYGLVPNGDELQGHPQPQVSDVVSLAADGKGALWIVNGSGGVWSRSKDGAWRPHDFATGVLRVAAAQQAEEVWFETMDGLWVYDQAEFRPVLGVSGALLAALDPGRALISSAQGTLRIATRRRVDLVGLDDGALLSAPTEVLIYPLEPAAVVSVTASVDEQPIAVQAGLRILLDPADLADGTHTLTVTADYGAEQVQASLRFSRYAGPPPTWLDDVQPLFTARCALCHGAQGSARRLDSATIWAEQIDSILDNVRTGRMPLPPNPSLTPEEVARVEGWAAAGFPEGT